MIVLAMALLQTAPTQVGIVPDPCSALPPPPAVVADYFARAAKAKAANQPLPPRSEAGMAIYAEWQRALLLADFAGFCRYRVENAQLPPASSARIVFFGDSITEGWPQHQPGFFAGDRINRGISGQTTTQMLARFRADVIDLKPRIVHIMAGTNDIAGNTGPTALHTIEANIATMVELARAHGIRVVIGSVLPARRFDWRPGIEPATAITELNRRLKALAARQGAGFADYHAALDDGAHGLSAAHAEDGVHPTAAGYAVMQPIAERALTAARRRRAGYNALR